MVRINMRATHAILPWAVHEGGNANDVISARIPAVINGRRILALIDSGVPIGPICAFGAAID